MRCSYYSFEESGRGDSASVESSEHSGMSQTWSGNERVGCEVEGEGGGEMRLERKLDRRYTEAKIL